MAGTTYYLCQTKTCDAYGESIKRDKIEGHVGEMIADLQPTPGLIALARAMSARLGMREVSNQATSERRRNAS